MPDDREIIDPGSRAAWRQWLADNAGRTSGAWILIAKVGTDGLRYEDAVLEAVAAGWIDSTSGAHDDTRYRIWFAPRRHGSGWSPSNKARVSRLQAEGLMTPRGQAVVDAALADGSWHKLDAAGGSAPPGNPRSVAP